MEDKKLTTNISEEFKKGYELGKKGTIKIEDVEKIINLWKTNSEDITLEEYLRRELKKLGERE